MRHAMNDAQSDVGERHACHILPQRHVFAALWIIVHGGAQRTADQFDRLQVQRIRQLPGSQRRIAFNRMGQRIHAGRGS